MRTFARKQNQPQKQVFSSTARSDIVRTGPDKHRHPIRQLQRGIGNQAMQHVFQIHVEEPSHPRIVVREFGAALPKDLATQGSGVFRECLHLS